MIQRVAATVAATVERPSMGVYGSDDERGDGPLTNPVAGSSI
jgi:hypothetical protein